MKNFLTAMFITASIAVFADDSRTLNCSGLNSDKKNLTIAIIDKKDLSQYDIIPDDIPEDADVAVIGNYQYGEFFGLAVEEEIPGDMLLNSYQYSGFADELGFFELLVSPDVFNPKNNHYSVKIYDVLIGGGLNVNASKGDLLEEIEVQCK